MGNPSQEEIDEQLEIFLTKLFGRRIQINEGLFNAIMIFGLTFLTSTFYNCVFELVNHFFDVFELMEDERDYGLYGNRETSSKSLIVVASLCLVSYAVFHYVYGSIKVRDALGRFILYQNGFKSLSGTTLATYSKTTEPIKKSVGSKRQAKMLFSEADLPIFVGAHLILYDAANFIIFTFVSRVLHLSIWKLIVTTYNLFMQLPTLDDMCLFYTYTKMMSWTFLILLCFFWIYMQLVVFSIFRFRSICGLKNLVTWCISKLY